MYCLTVLQIDGDTQASCCSFQATRSPPWSCRSCDRSTRSGGDRQQQLAIAKGSGSSKEPDPWWELSEWRSQRGPSFFGVGFFGIDAVMNTTDDYSLSGQKPIFLEVRCKAPHF